jgi:hypothetical protein
MSKFRTLFGAVALGLIATGGATAQGTGRVNLTPLLTSQQMILAAQHSENSLTNVSLRGGAMISPRGGGLVGLDFAMPTLSLGSGWHGRLDGDVIFKANFGGINDIIPVTVDQLYYSPEAFGGRGIYFGAGVGAVLSGPAKFDGKLILGTELAKRLGAEVNIHFTEHDTLVTVLGRLHL